MPNLTSYAFVISVGVLMAGCAQSGANPDPSQGGFISGIQGTVGGGYQRRIDEREDMLVGEETQQQALLARAESLRQEREQISYELNRAETRLDKVSSRLSALRAQLNSEKGRQSEAWQTLQEAQAKLKATEKSYRVASSEVASLPVADSQKNVRNINDDLGELEALASIVDELSAGL